MVSWPDTIPDCPNDWSESDKPIVIRSEVDVGTAKVRRRMTRALILGEAEFRLTKTDLAIFQSFFRVDCQSGAVAFDWPHPITGTPMTWRFREPPQTRLLDPIGYWSVRVTMEQI